MPDPFTQLVILVSGLIGLVTGVLAGNLVHQLGLGQRSGPSKGPSGAFAVGTLTAVTAASYLLTLGWPAAALHPVKLELWFAACLTVLLLALYSRVAADLELLVVALEMPTLLAELVPAPAARVLTSVVPTLLKALFLVVVVRVWGAAVGGVGLASATKALEGLLTSAIGLLGVLVIGGLALTSRPRLEASDDERAVLAVVGVAAVAVWVGTGFVAVLLVVVVLAVAQSPERMAKVRAMWAGVVRKVDASGTEEDAGPTD